MKDLAWLKEVVLEATVELLARKTFGGYESGYMDAITLFQDAMDEVDQVEQPETLSQEWIDDHKVARISNLRKMTMSDVVPAERLEGLLMPNVVNQADYNDIYDKGYKDSYKTAKNQTPEQPELPVIPEYVAEYIEGKKEKGLGLRFIFWSIEGRHVHSRYMGKCQRWIYNNSELFSRAWLDGYAVEEKKYKVLIGQATDTAGLFLSKGDHTGDVVFETHMGYYSVDSDALYLTEEEIKSFMGGVYWPFAIPEEEVGKPWQENLK